MRNRRVSMPTTFIPKNSINFSYREQFWKLFHSCQKPIKLLRSSANKTKKRTEEEFSNGFHAHSRRQFPSVELCPNMGTKWETERERGWTGETRTLVVRLFSLTCNLVVGAFTRFSRVSLDNFWQKLIKLVQCCAIIEQSLRGSSNSS